MRRQSNKPKNKICVMCGTEYVGCGNSRKYCDVCKVIRYKETMKLAWTKSNHKKQEQGYKKNEDGKKRKCLICGAWTKAPAMHAYQKHGVSAHDYKEAFKIPYGEGLIPKELKEIKKDYVFANNTVKNLKKGASYRFKKGEKRIYEGVLRKKDLGIITRLTIHT